MLRWLDMLAGPLVWTLHFAIVYGIASISLQASGAVTSEARLAIIIAGVVLAPVIAIIAFWPRRSDSEARFRPVVRMSGAIISIIAIVWQTLPIILR